MSRRYGRNQKRRHREELAEEKKRVALLEESLVLDDVLRGEMRRKLAEAENCLNDMVETIKRVCRFSVVVPPERFPGNKNIDRFDLAIIDEEERMAYEAVFAPITQKEYRVVSLQALRVYLKKNIESFRVAVHLRYGAEHGSVYMLSEKALRSLPMESLGKSLAPQVTHELIRHLRG